MYPTDTEIFIDYIGELFGEEDAIHTIDSSREGLLPISVFIYHNLPDEGFMTAVTYGLSEAENPEWTDGKPELILTLKTSDETWAIAAAFFAEKFRTEKSFAYGNVFMLDQPISKESSMSGYLVYKPAILQSQHYKLNFPKKVLKFMGLYPIYNNEIDHIQKIGFAEFLKDERLDLFSVTRPDLSK